MALRDGQHSLGASKEPAVGQQRPRPRRRATCRLPRRALSTRGVVLHQAQWCAADLGVVALCVMRVSAQPSRKRNWVANLGPLCGGGSNLTPDSRRIESVERAGCACGRLRVRGLHNNAFLPPQPNQAQRRLTPRVCRAYRDHARERRGKGEVRYKQQRHTRPAHVFDLTYRTFLIPSFSSSSQIPALSTRQQCATTSTGTSRPASFAAAIRSPAPSTALAMAATSSPARWRLRPCTRVPSLARRPTRSRCRFTSVVVRPRSLVSHPLLHPFCHPSLLLTASLGL